MRQINTLEVNRRADLLALAGAHTSLTARPVASTGGGEYSGPCPFCGGHDRFRVQPNNPEKPVWLCRNCTDGKWQDAITLARRLYPGLPFPDVCKMLTNGELPTCSIPRPAPAPCSATAPPLPEWQEAGISFVEACERELWQPSGARALAWLRARGLKDETIRRFNLGFHPTSQRTAWDSGETRWVDYGIVIPCFAKGALWYIKIRRPAGDPKYRQVSGGQPIAVFNADDLLDHPVILMVEGEFDALICWQELRRYLPVGTMGAAGYVPDLATWGRYFFQKRAVLLCYDDDQAGMEGAAKLAYILAKPLLAPLPSGPWKDVTDYHLAGGDLYSWISKYLDICDPVTVTSNVEESNTNGER